MVRRVRFGVVILPELRWPAAQELWRRAEELGFDHAWTYDHLAWRSLRDSPWFAAVPTLTAAALATERIRLGTLVASPNFRHPVVFARELITLDDVSGGRFTLGVGSGGGGWDAAMLGQDPWSPRERADRFAEFVELLDRLLREPALSYRGRHYQAVEARTFPGCVQQPRLPFAVAAAGARAMRVATAYADTWVTVGDVTSDPARTLPVLPAAPGAAVVRAQMGRLDELCGQVGRHPLSLRRLVLTGPLLDGGLSSLEAFRDTAGRYAEAGVTDFVVHWPRPAEPYAGDAGAFERIMAEVMAS
jgi:alkanesulfonate monooxygenase SsuD/methylene tetrahydromethanopterin reductase-like flavin-dependent oxidoreductase (luciferase family)